MFLNEIRKLVTVFITLLLLLVNQSVFSQSGKKLIIGSNVERLERGFVLASQEKYALDVPEKDELIENYMVWLNGQGNLLMNKFRRGEEFNSKEKPYWRLARASYIWKAQRMYERFEQGDETLDEAEMEANEFAASLWEEGAELMKRGYFGERFSDEEIERLWEYRVICEIRICCPTPYYPYNLGIHRFGEKKGPFYIGKELPHISWMKMEGAMESPFYTDIPTEDLYEVIKPDALDDFFQCFRGYSKQTAADGREYVEEIFPQSVPGDNRYVRISDSRGKKPVLIFVAAAMDCFWGQAVMEAEAIYRAYQEQIDVIWVTMPISDFLIFGNTTYNYYKPYAGVELPGHESNQQDLARTAKKVYMTYPQLTLPCVLDQNSHQTANYFKTGGGSGITALIDVDGKIAWHSTYGWGHWYKNRPPGRGYCEEINWGNAVEKEIHKLLDNNGKYDPDHELCKILDEKSKNARPNGIKSMYMSNGTITDIDRQNRIITVKAQPSTFAVTGRYPDSTQLYNPLQSFIISVPPETKITCRNVPVGLDKLNVGNHVISPDIWKMPDGSWLAKHIRLIPTEEMLEELPPMKFIGDMYLYGKILEVNVDRNILKVMRDKADINQMKGYSYIKEGGDKVELVEMAVNNYATVEKWVEKDKSPKPYLFDMEGALLMLNGNYVELSELKTGDFISIRYAAEDEDKEKLRCAVARATRTTFN